MDTITLPLGNPLTAQIDIMGVWHIAIFAGLLALILGMIWRIRAFPIEFKLLWSYVLGYSLFLFEFPALHFGLYDRAFQWTSAQVFAEAAVIPLGAVLFWRIGVKVLPYVVAFSLACVWFKLPGLMIAPSFNTALCAAAILFVPWWLKIAVLLTIATHHGTTAMMIIAAQLLAFAIKDRKGRAVIAVGIPSLLVLAYIHSNGPLLDGMERLETYKAFMTFWASKWKWIVVGVGPGSFMWT